MSEDGAPWWHRLIVKSVQAVLTLVSAVFGKVMGVDMAKVRRMPGKRRPPATYQARWRISYVDVDGVITERVVRVRRINLKTQRLYAWCETRQGLRTFKLSGVKSAHDASTGRPVTPAQWTNHEGPAQ